MSKQQIISKMKKIGLTPKDLLNNGLSLKKLIKSYPTVREQCARYIKSNEKALKKLACY